MAARVLRRATALGLVAAAAVSAHTLATWKPPVHLLPDTLSHGNAFLSSSLSLQVALRRARPLYAEHARSVRAQAERDLARVDASRAEGGDPAAADDLRLLLAVRDGRADDALQLYEQAARDSPFDPRPLVLALYVCIFTNRGEDTKRWIAAYGRLPESEIQYKYLGFESRELAGLIHELVVAASLAGLFPLSVPAGRIFVVGNAAWKLDAVLADETLSTAETLLLRALRAYLDSTSQRLLTRGGGAQAAE